MAKDGIAFWAPTTVVQRPEDRPTPGEGCRVRVGKELRLAIAGYYVAIGDAEEDDEDGDGAAVPMVRYYWHLTAPASPRFLETATSPPERGLHPVSDQGPTVDPYGYHRADAGVLFLHRVNNPAVGPIIAAIHSAIAPGSDPGRPCSRSGWLMASPTPSRRPAR